MNTALEYSTRVVQEGGRRCKKSTLNDLVHLTPLRIPLMNPPNVRTEQTVLLLPVHCTSSVLYTMLVQTVDRIRNVPNKFSYLVTRGNPPPTLLILKIIIHIKIMIKFTTSATCIPFLDCLAH
jgi:hypothetical protein